MSELKTYKGFVNDINGNRLLPITRGELILDAYGNLAFTSSLFEAGKLGEYGLISISDLNKLKSISGGNVNISDLSTKINYINTGIKVGNTILNYYTVEDTITSTPISFASNGSLSITTANNIITIGLPEINNGNDVASLTNTFIRAITVDKYGIVKSVSGGLLTNDDIPETLENKTLSGCTTESVANNNYAIVNKKYVDDKIIEGNIANIGALIFGGIITNTIYTNNSILSANNVNHYYKVTESFIINKEHLYSEESNIIVRSGDTLIVYNDKTDNTNPYKFVYIPSADETETTIHIPGVTQNPLIGNINLSFTGGGLNTTVDGNTINVALPAASRTTNGYLTKELYSNIAQPASGDNNGYLTAADYVKFSSFAAKSITFTPTLNTGYKIGTFAFDDQAVSLYGKEYSLVLNQSSENSNVNPKISFTGSDNSTKDITFTGGNYIQVIKSQDSEIKISAITGTNGLTAYSDYSTLNDKVNTLNSTVLSHIQLGTYFFTIENSLTDTEKTYYYGSEALKAAVTLDIL